MLAIVKHDTSDGALSARRFPAMQVAQQDVSHLTPNITLDLLILTCASSVTCRQVLKHANAVRTANATYET